MIIITVRWWPEDDGVHEKEDMILIRFVVPSRIRD
jgi:hypothetical protein